MRKFIKKYFVYLSIILVVLLFFLLMVFIKQQKKYDRNPWLIPPKNSYNRIINMPLWEKEQYESKVKEYSDLINNFVSTTWEKEIDLWNWMIGVTIEETNPDADRFVQKAIYLQKLWRNKEAILTINELFKIYNQWLMWWNRLGLIYEEIWEYDLAIKCYKSIIANYQDILYYKRIIDVLVKEEKFQEAFEYYMEYSKFWWERSEYYENIIKNWIKESKMKK